MSTLNTFFGPPVATAIIGGDTTASSDTILLTATAATRAGANLRTYLAGTTVANTYKTVISVTGSGFLRFLAGVTVNGTSRTIAMRLTIDGVVVNERTAVAVNAVGRALVVAGSVDAAFSATTTLELVFADIRFNKSMLVEMRSSLSETDLIAAWANYELTN